MLRLSGPQARGLLQSVSGLGDLKPRRLVVADLGDPRSSTRIDSGLVCWMPGPRSYTGEDVVEVFGHGGVLNMAALLGLFVELGARQAEPGEFTRRAFVNGRMDLTQAEAVAEVIAARSERALRNAHALLGGQLGQKVRALRAKTVELAADLEACLDFAEDLDAPVSPQRLVDGHRALIEDLGALASSYRVGQRLNGVAVALVGRVNGGKSSLFNALLGTRRALVSTEEGTTRDYLEAELSWEGLAVTLVDTAGQRPAEQMSALERAGRDLGAERVGRCDVWIDVVDLSEPTTQLASEAVPCGDRPVIIAANKVDLVEQTEASDRCTALQSRSATAVVPTSALTGQGLEELRRQVLTSVLGEQQLDAQVETVQVTQGRHFEALTRTTEALSQGLAMLQKSAPPEVVVEHTREALSALGTITGEAFTEDVLDSVFARFCIGK